MKDGLIIYAAGRRCVELYKVLTNLNINILLIVDSDKNKWGMKIGNIFVDSPEKIKKYRYAKVCITIADNSIFNDIKKMLQEKYDINKENIISYYKVIIKVFYHNILFKDYILKSNVQRSINVSTLFESISGLHLGGVPAWTLDVCKALIRCNDSYEYIVTDKDNYDIPQVLMGHILSVEINHKERFSIRTVKNLIDIIIKKMPCKVITSATNEMMLAAYLVKKYYPQMVEIISVIHNSNENVYSAYLEFKECIDLFIGVSQDIQRDMIKRGIAPDKVYSMTCPFACEVFLNRIYTESRAYPICIGYAGRIEYEQKRMDLLLKFVELLVKRKVNFKMELAGDGLAKEEMEIFIKEKHLDKYVLFLGKICREEIPKFWQRQDICVNLADYEGRCISKLEAMANGAVPIITAVAGVHEDIVNDVNGYIVPVGDYISAVDKVEFLERHRERLAEMGKKAHDEVYPKSLMEPHLAFWKKILYGTSN